MSYRSLSILVCIIFVFFVAADCYVDICAPILAKIAYNQQEVINQFTCPQCKLFTQKCKGYDGLTKSIKVFPNTNNQLQFYSLVKTNPQINATFIFIVFRGFGSSEQQTQKWINTLGQSKISYLKQGCSNCNVHKGLFQSYVKIRSQIIDQINNIVKNYNESGLSFNVSIIGHGFGGAMATFASIDIVTQYKSIYTSLITYGQPRVGDSNFASFVVRSLNKTQRNIHYSDLVPHFPSQSSGFVHYNMEYWYEISMKTYKICLSENPTCSNSINSQNYSIKDNSINQYFKITSNYDYDINCSVINKSMRFPANTQIIMPVQISFHYLGFQIPEQMWVGIYTLLSQDFPICFDSSKTPVVFQTNKTIQNSLCDFGTYMRPYNYTFYIVGKVQVNNYLKRQQCKGQIHLEIY